MERKIHKELEEQNMKEQGYVLGENRGNQAEVDKRFKKFN